MNTFQKKRLIRLILILILTASVVGLSAYALKNNLNFFYTPTQLSEQKLSPDYLFRLGGIVKKGSLARKNRSVFFVVSDKTHSVPVKYQGILPDLFREGQSVVIEGYLDLQGVMQAKRVLAKHDERYQSTYPTEP